MPTISAAQTVAAPTQAASLFVAVVLSAAQTLPAPTQQAGLAVPVSISSTQTAAAPTNAATLGVLVRLAAAQTAPEAVVSALLQVSGTGPAAAPTLLTLAWLGQSERTADEWQDGPAAWQANGEDMLLRLVTGPASEPISLADAKLHLRVDDPTEDALIALRLSAARELVEGMTGRALLPQTYELRLRSVPSSWRAIELPIAPLLAVTGVQYQDTVGSLTTLDPSSYAILQSAGPRAMPGRLQLAPGATWPAMRTHDSQALRIVYQVGYADAASVPAPLKAAVLLVLGDLHENREASLATRTAYSDNPTVERLLAPYRIWNL